MSGILIIFFMVVSHADETSMDAKRLENFNGYLLKKEAYEEKRQRSAAKEKERRILREESYEKKRSSFRRPVHTEPPGKENYARKLEELEKRYERIRDSFSAKQQRSAEALFQKIDRTKMIEYEL